MFEVLVFILIVEEMDGCKLSAAATFDLVKRISKSARVVSCWLWSKEEETIKQ